MQPLLSDVGAEAVEVFNLLTQGGDALRTRSCLPTFPLNGRVGSKLDASNFPGLIIRQPNFGNGWAIVHINMPATDSAGRHRIKRKFLCGRIEFAQYVLV